MSNQHREDFLDAIRRVLHQLRRSHSSDQFASIDFGQALGWISAAEHVNAISSAEGIRLGELATNASTYARKERGHA